MNSWKKTTAFFSLLLSLSFISSVYSDIPTEEKINLVNLYVAAVANKDIKQIAQVMRPDTKVYAVIQEADNGIEFFRTLFASAKAIHVRNVNIYPPEPGANNSGIVADLELAIVDDNSRNLSWGYYLDKLETARDTQGALYISKLIMAENRFLNNQE